MRLWPKLLPIVVLAAVVGGDVMSGTFGVQRDVVHFDAKTIVLSPTDDGVMQVTEYVDINFGRNQMRGYLRYVRTDFGFPVDIMAESETMPSNLSTDFDGDYFEMRVGDPDVTANGQHRFVLSYVLPFALLDEWWLNYSLIDPDEDPITYRFHVILDGFRLDDSLCSVGGWGEEGGCELVDTPFGQEVLLEPLEATAGLNISGMSQLTGVRMGDREFPLPEPGVPSSQGVLAVLVALALLVGAGLAVRRNIRRGKNIVGAPDAAGAAIPVAGGPTARVSDTELFNMATVEFAAPQGIRPWEGNVIIHEHPGSDLQSNWVSSMIGQGVLSIEKDGQAVDISLLVSRDDLGDVDRRLVDLLLPGNAESRRVYKKYTETFAETWKEIRSELVQELDNKGWWTHQLRTWHRRMSVKGAWVWSVSFGALLYVVDSNLSNHLVPNFITDSAVGILIVSAAIGLALGELVTKGRVASRTAAGSAAYLQTESFRRFLAQSEGRHVEEAHRRGVLREYSAWAVVLGEATAWRKAAESLDDVAIASEVDLTQSSLGYITVLSAATEPPSSSGSSGSSGGGGGGGGGGGSGGW